MIPVVVTYNLASIAKMGYKDTDNNEIFIKVRGAQDEDDEGEEGEPAQDSTVPTLDHIWMFWGRFNSILVILTQDLIVWMSVLTPWVLKWPLLIVK